MKLNLGCGSDIREGYVNVDFRALPGVDLEVDLSKFPWPFEDASADEILMLDFLEHFPYSTTPFILLECHRILSDKGTVVIQVPDGEHLMHALAVTGSYLCNRCGTEMNGNKPAGILVCTGCGQTDEQISEAAMRRLYGGQDYPGNFHQTCFTKRTLRGKAKDCGLDLSGYEEEPHQRANWNFKARFHKGDLW